MTIDKEKLIELLTEKTGFKKEQVEGQLSELIKRIREAAQEGENFEIETFGTFNLHDDKLRFSPSSELKTEINNQYAGMEPIELVGSYQETERGPKAKKTIEPGEEEPETAPEHERSGKEEEPDEVPTAYPETEGEPVTSEEEDIEPGTDEEEKEDESQVKDQPSASFTLEEELELEQPEEQSEKAEEAPWDQDEEPESEPQRSSEEESEEVSFPLKEAEADREEPVAAEETAEEERKAKWEPAPELRDTGTRSTPKEEGDMIGNILIILVIIVAAGVGVWFAYDMGLFPGLAGSSGQQINNTGNQQHQQQVEQRQQDPPAVQNNEPDDQSPGDPDSPESNDGSDTPQEEQSSEPEEQNEVAESETGQSTYGLKGDPIPEANNGYTIVVHSIRSVTKARNIRDQLKNEGYRTVLTDAIVNGQRYWRIGVGQFETVGDAQEAADELEEPFSSNFFIKRIES